MKKSWYAFGLTFTDVFEIHEKIDVNIAGDVWKKRGVRRFQNEYEQGRANFLMIFVKKALFFIDPTNLRLQPGVRVAKNVRTPYSVWGISAVQGGPKLVQKHLLKTHALCVDGLKDIPSVSRRQ